MAKNKQINIRVSEEFYDLLSGYSQFLGISITALIVDSVLCKEYVMVEKEANNKDLEKYFYSLSNNVNQMARTLNAINRELKETADKDLLMEKMDFRSFAIELHSIHERLKSIDKKGALKDRGLYAYSKKRKIYKDLEEYLIGTGQEIYLENLRNRTNAV